MLTAKPWKAEAVARLGLSVFVCVYAGSLLLIALQRGAAAGWALYPILAAAFGCLGASLILLCKPWQMETVLRRLAILLPCLYAGLFLGLWGEKLAGEASRSVDQMIVGVASFQGAGLVLVHLFLREHGVAWSEAFGFDRQWRKAVPLGMLVACLFLPIGIVLQWAIGKALPSLPPPEAVQTLQLAGTWLPRLVLGVVTILLAPVAEEVLFRGILYPWLKQFGYPRLALWTAALAFAAVHLNLFTFVPLALLAVALTVLYERTDNLLAPITAHALFNGFNFVMLYVFQQQMSRFR